MRSSDASRGLDAWRQYIADAQHLACVVTHAGLILTGELVEVTAQGVTLAALDAFSPPQEVEGLRGADRPPLGWAFVPWGAIEFVTEGSDQAVQVERLQVWRVGAPEPHTPDTSV